MIFDTRTELELLEDWSSRNINVFFIYPYLHPTRARDALGRFQEDDPATEKNEAWRYYFGQTWMK
jgi:hypothetical protein